MSPPWSSVPEPDDTGRVLRAAGPRPEVPAEKVDRVRLVVRHHWRREVERRAVRRRLWYSAALALTAGTLAVLLGPVWRGSGARAPVQPAIVASVDRIEGVVQALAGAHGGTARTLTPDAEVRAGEWIVTSSSRVSLRLRSGGSARFDAGSRARLVSTAAVELVEGAVYIDTHENLMAFEVRTPFGTATDVGTQFEVRLQPSTLRVRVRTGMVELLRDEHAISARQGTELIVTGDDTVSGPIRAFGPEWDWAVQLAPDLESDNRSLASFLHEVSRELGWTLRYADSGLERRAATITLHGSVRGLTPREALSVVLTTSGLDSRLSRGELTVVDAAARAGQGP